MARLMSCYLLCYLLCLRLTQCGYTLHGAHIARQGDPTNLTDLINQRSSGDGLVPTHVVELLKTLSDKPACHKAATHQLITSCQSIREDTLNPRHSIEDLEARKSVFAARLAICELREANANIPSQCKPLLSNFPDAFERVSSNPLQLSASQQVGGADLRACLRALEAKPQSWTSYSNSRQHAALICDVSRTEIMKDEALNLFRLLTGLGSEMNQALADALQRASSQQEAEMAFAEALKDLHTEQLQDLVKAQQENKAILQEGSSQVVDAVHRVSDTIHSAAISATVLKKMVETIFLSAAAGGAELASIRLRDAEANREVGLAFKEMVQDVASHDLAILREGLRESNDMAVRAENKTLDNVITKLEQDLTRGIIRAVQEDSSGLEEVVQGTSITVKQTAQEMLLLQDSTLAAAQNVQASSALAEGMLRTIMEAKENFGPLKELFELLTIISYAVQGIFSKDTAILLAISAFLGASVVSVSCCVGLRHGYYLAACYFQIFAVVLVVRFVPWSDWAGLAIRSPIETSSLLGTLAIARLVLHARSRHRLFYALKLRRRLLSAPSATAKAPDATRWVPITAKEMSSIAQQSHRQERQRSRRAQTTPPRL